MPTQIPQPSLVARLLTGITIVTALASCGLGPTGTESQVLHVGAIPDQNPEKLNRLYSSLSDELSDQLKVPVQYVPVSNYPAAVTAFRTGSLDLVWFGGLTGVQARLQTCLLYTSPSPRDGLLSRMPSSA